MDNNIYAISYKMRKELYARVVSVLKVLFLCFFAVSIFMSFVAYPVVSRSNSMSPDITSGNVDLVVPLLKTPSRGDVFLIQPNGGDELGLAKRAANQFFLFFTARKWCPFSSGDSQSLPMVRRVIGMPGDTIYIDKYVVYIKPEGEQHFLTEFEVVEKKYDVEVIAAPTNWDINLGAKSGTEQIVLGEGEYYLLGDNRMECVDSRLWGAVGKEAFLGKVVLQYFPFNRFRIF